MIKKIGLVFVCLFIILGSITSSDLCINQEENETCHATNRNPYRYYGTKTAYHVVADNGTVNDIILKGCTPKVLYLLSRHATRYPDTKYIKDLGALLPPLKDTIMNSSRFGRTKLCEEDLKMLREWELNMKPEDGDRISTTGEDEAVNLARRLQKRFPSIFEKHYSPQKFKFHYTSRERTRSTAEAFAKGLFGIESKNIDFENKTKDDVLQFHKTCKSLRKVCKNTPDEKELEKIEKGTFIAKVIENVSKRGGCQISKAQLHAIYTSCVFGYALNQSDAWCSLLSARDLKILEFQDDIEDYYKDSYGDAINPKSACPVVKYVVELFKNITDTKAAMHFTHSGAVKKVYAMLGLFQDKHPLTADGFCTQTDRKWRSSLICPFNSNLELVYYECEDEHKVAGFVNERAVKLKGCKSELCSWKDFYETYGPIGEECDINKLCCTCCKP